MYIIGHSFCHVVKLDVSTFLICIFSQNVHIYHMSLNDTCWDQATSHSPENISAVGAFLEANHHIIIAHLITLDRKTLK